MCGDFSTVIAASMHQGYTSIGPNIALPCFPSNMADANIAPYTQEDILVFYLEFIKMPQFLEDYILMNL
jgi:hypothetical protein